MFVLSLGLYALQDARWREGLIEGLLFFWSQLEGRDGGGATDGRGSGGGILVCVH